MLATKDIQVEKVPTKRRYIYQTLRRQLLSREMQPGSPLPAANELAGHFGVSYMTMHLALADLVRDGLIVRHKRKGTFTADRATQKQRPTTSHLVLVLPEQEDIEQYGSTEEVSRFVRGASQGVAGCGADLGVLSVPSFPTADDTKAMLHNILRYDGALFFGVQYSAVIEELAKRNFAVVVLGGDPTPVSSVGHDFHFGLRMAIEHIVQHGYKKIGYFGSTTTTLSKVKHEFFRDLAAEHGLELRSEWDRPCELVADAAAAAREFVQQDSLPEVVFVDNHHKTNALVLAAKDRGLRIPDHLAVVGYGADISGLAQAEVTMVSIPYEAEGREGAALLDKIVRGAVLPPMKKSIQSRLVIRHSCGCAAAKEHFEVNPSVSSNLTDKN